MTDDEGTPQDATGLWTDSPAELYAGNHEKYYQLLFDQYNMYVQTSTEISRARLQTNAFFITLHTALIAGIAVVLFESDSSFLYGAGFLGLLAGVALSIVWLRLLKSYRTINTAKFKVIGQLETRLPASPLWRAEWSVLSRPASGYVPLTSIEAAIPWITIATYGAILVYALAFWMFPQIGVVLQG